MFWYTDPSNGNFAGHQRQFSSFYQYEPSTGKFVRIRLELDRADANPDPSIIYREQRLVGFDANVHSVLPADIGAWSIYNDRLYFNRVALPTTPTVGDHVYDTSDLTRGVHRGNPVTDNPHFPPGIEAKHLCVIANEAILKNVPGEVTLTAANAGTDRLTAAIQQKVSEIMDTRFDRITDQDLIDKLKEQMIEIRSKAISLSEDKIRESMEQVSNILDNIKTMMDNGQLTPNPDLEQAFRNMKEAVAPVTDALDNWSDEGGDAGDALADLERNYSDLVDVINTLAAAPQEAFERALNGAGDALKDARGELAAWESVNNEYEWISNVDNVDEYVDSAHATEVAE